MGDIFEGHGPILCEDGNTQCAVAYHEGGDPTGVDSVEALASELKKAGYVGEPAREAAVAALLSIKRFDVFVSATESRPLSGPVRLHTSWSRGYNGPFWQKVAEHWTFLKVALGDDLFHRLTDRDAARTETWESLAIVARHSKELTADIVAQALTAAPQELGPNTLRLLTREGSSQVREVLFESMKHGVADTLWGPWYRDSGITASELLAERFSGDENTLALLTAHVPAAEPPAVLPLVALCVGWPTCDRLAEVFQYCRTEKVPLPWLGHGAIVATKGDGERVAKIISKYDEYSAPLRRLELRIVTRLMVRRLRDDDDVFEQALAARGGIGRANEVMLLRLLVAARGLSNLRAEIESIVCQELDGEEAPTVLRDPVSGLESTASRVLLDGTLAR
ncbi:hypothetical protein [Nannocystis radixulma]|uniref:HEAT repeat domain-containing protein n=1 Tax=Nannocystis radixulma TaxID=2995305 RepID=A0ABT5BDM0_9BACT|nr:hypothetical protein [Nannocystis radixulma]MDC0672240.1 hypothetical protein [Nannocystis radixulma]